MRTNSTYTIPILAQNIAKSFGVRDDLYRYSLLKRVVKSAIMSQHELTNYEFLAKPESTKNEGWDAVISGLSDYLAERMYNESPPKWTASVRYKGGQPFNPVIDYFPDGFETLIPEQFRRHNVAIPEGGVQCYMSSVKQN